MNVRLADHPQGYKLQCAMTLERVRRGDKACVSIPNVRIDPLPGSFAERGALYFCDINPLRNVARIKAGVGKWLPKEVKLIGTLTVDTYGHGDLHGVELFSDAEVIYVDVTNARFVSRRTIETIPPEMMEEAGEAVKKLMAVVTGEVMVEEEGG